MKHSEVLKTQLLRLSVGKLCPICCDTKGVNAQERAAG